MVAMGPLPTASSRRGSNNSSNRPPIGGGASSSMNQPSNSANTAVVEGIHSLPNTHSSAPSSKHKKHSASRHPTTSTANIHNSAAHYSSLLARGWTSRNALPSALNPLRGDEIEKDVRHMQAYGQAAEAYQMQLYLQMNGTVPRHHAHQDMIMMNAAANSATSNGQASSLHHPAAVHHGHGAATTTTTTPGGLALPVRIDPEEEKRLFVLRKKIAVAEQFREQAEQEWVAHQAHYVHMAARLRQAQTQRAATTQLLQTCLQNKASVLAQARLRLQMTRDVYAALQTRQGRLMEKTADNTAMAVDGGSTTNNNKNNSSGTAPSDADAEDVLTELWTLAEEDYKRACTALVNGTNTSGENNNSKDGKTAGGGKKKKSSTQQQSSVISWEGTHLTMTPTDVPLLVSVLSNVPDKTVAYGGDPKNMIWLPHHLKKRYLSSSNTDNRSGAMEEDGTSAHPSLDKDKLDLGFMIDDMDDNQNDDEDDDEFIANDENHPHNSRNQHHFTDQALQQRVAELQDELKRERTLNQEWSAKIAASRKSNDEWVSMMSLVRQETEALLHRHNILLESDQALAASEQLHAQEMKEQQEAEAAAAAAKEQEGPDEEETDAKQEEVPTTDKVAPPTVPALPSGLSALDALTAAAEQSESLPTPDDAPKGGRKTSSKVNTTTAAEEAANDGDDEGGSGGEDPPEDDWAATTTTSVEAGKKRNNGSTAETGTAEEENAAKRRKVE